VNSFSNNHQISWSDGVYVSGDGASTMMGNSKDFMRFAKENENVVVVHYLLHRKKLVALHWISSMVHTLISLFIRRDGSITQWVAFPFERAVSNTRKGAGERGWVRRWNWHLFDRRVSWTRRSLCSDK